MANPPQELDNSGDKPLCVPGYGLPFNYVHELSSAQRFAHGVADLMHDRFTAREVAMMQVMDQLTDKPDWRQKVFDEAIVAKWRQEAKNMELISEAAFEWCIRELRDKATEGGGKFTTTLVAGSRCVKADDLISKEIHQDLIDCIQPLLDAPVKDWHPGSNEQVLNLVHPSLYHLVYGKTRVLTSGQVELEDILEARDDTVVAPAISLNASSPPLGWSSKYQWLPCDVSFSCDDGLDVKITSYINNLPCYGHEELYKCIEQLISASIPLWNEVVVEHNRLSKQRIVTTSVKDLDEADKKWMYSLPSSYWQRSEETWGKAAKELTEYLKKPDRAENLRALELKNEVTELDPDWVSQRQYANVAEWKYNRVRRVVHPEPFKDPTYEKWREYEANLKFSLENTFRQQGLQVITKIASIELTPEKPTYDGGNWHLEGMLNEHITATAIYYFDVSNVTESRIHFRQDAELDGEEVEYDQNDFLPLEIVFGIDDLSGGKKLQEIGSIVTKQNRLLAFPNTRQHRVDPFELIDKTRPGHRRFIVLWLVDPHYRILSTKNVPPQQHHWWKTKMATFTDALDPDHYLPPEVKDHISEELKDGTMTKEQAEAYRLDLMAERTSSTDRVHQSVDTYFFCEH